MFYWYFAVQGQQGYWIGFETNEENLMVVCIVFRSTFMYCYHYCSNIISKRRQVKLGYVFIKKKKFVVKKILNSNKKEALEKFLILFKTFDMGFVILGVFISKMIFGNYLNSYICKSICTSS